MINWAVQGECWTSVTGHAQRHASSNEAAPRYCNSERIMQLMQSKVSRQYANSSRRAAALTSISSLRSHAQQTCSDHAWCCCNPIRNDVDSAPVAALDSRWSGRIGRSDSEGPRGGLRSTGRPPQSPTLCACSTTAVNQSGCLDRSGSGGHEGYCSAACSCIDRPSHSPPSTSRPSSGEAP